MRTASIYNAPLCARNGFRLNIFRPAVFAHRQCNLPVHFSLTLGFDELVFAFPPRHSDNPLTR
ncbi:hypothetical protein BH23CHL4_BH23CHL4_12440 [soil metagenome]